MKATTRLLWSALLSLAIPTVAPAATVSGSATYRERIALTPNAAFEATLEDVSRADAAAEIIARYRKPNPGQVPIEFTISYDSARIRPDHRYVVRATIRESGNLRFTSDEAHPVLTGGEASSVTILMRAVRTGGQTGAAVLGKLPATFAGLLPCADCAGIRYQINLMPGGAYMQKMTYLRDGHDDSFYEVGAWMLSESGRTLALKGGRRNDALWSVENAQVLRQLDLEGKPIDSKQPHEVRRTRDVTPMVPRVKFKGMFRYLADAPRFRDCRSNLEWPVAMTDDYRDLERAYTSGKAAPGSELLVTVQGRVEPRPKMEGEGTEPVLVVEEFENAMPGQACEESHVTSTGLENNRWRPVQIRDRPVAVTGQQREPWIHLDPKTKHLTGSGGCNGITGSYTVDGNRLRLGPLAATKMACLDMETEDAFFHALDEVRSYRVNGRVLQLMDEKGKVLVRLEERNL